MDTDSMKQRSLYRTVLFICTYYVLKVHITFKNLRCLCKIWMTEYQSHTHYRWQKPCRQDYIYLSKNNKYGITGLDRTWRLPCLLCVSQTAPAIAQAASIDISSALLKGDKDVLKQPTSALAVLFLLCHAYDCFNCWSLQLLVLSSLKWKWSREDDPVVVCVSWSCFMSQEHKGAF